LLHAADKPADLARKVIEAYGGRDAMKRWARGHVRYRSKGTALPFPEAVEAVVEEDFDYPGRFKRVVRARKDGTELTLTFVINKGQGWMHSAPRGTSPLPEASPAAADRDEHQFALFNNFTHLEDEGVTLTNLGEKAVGDRPAVVLRVTGEARTETEVYFDRASGLVLKTRAANARPDLIPGNLVETVHGDYKRFQGMVFPAKLRSTGGGEPVMEIDVLELTFPDKLDDAVFAKPG
jgi:hypothetical protein